MKSGYSNYPVTSARHYTDSQNLMRRLTVNEWVGTVSFLGLDVVLAACYWYEVAKPAHDGAEVLRTIQQVQIGRTRIQERQDLWRKPGACGAGSGLMIELFSCPSQRISRRSSARALECLLISA